VNPRTLGPSNAPPLQLTLVRHGETEGQSSVRYHGRTDVPLSVLGRTQMEQVRVALRGETFSAVYASTLSRAIEGATIVGRPLPVNPVVGFNEIDFGEWEGLTIEEIQARDPQRYAYWRANRTDFQYPGGDSTSAFRRRVVQTLHDLLPTASGRALLFILHKGVIRSILAELLGLDEARRRELTIDLASIHVVRHDGASWRAEGLDRTDHL
jgi:broad specificity phosphatase PhoE